MDSEKVAQFVGITGASESTAAFYLESCGGDAERAIQSFFDAGGAEAPTGGAPAPAAAPAATTGPSSLLAEAAAARAARAAAVGGAAAGAGPSSSRPVGSRRPAAAAGNVRSLGDSGGEESESEDDYNELYVGGDKSGQVVRGAPQDAARKGKGAAVDDIFEGAKAAGAEQGSYEDMYDDEEHEGGHFKAFSGTARTLAGGEAAPPQQQQGQRRAERRAVKIVFYANGVFTVDDGEPRSMNDPANLPFMEAIMRGQLPPELDPGDPSVQVNVNLLRSEEEYKPPAQPKVKAFTGTGHRLGGGGDAGGSGGASTSGAGAAPALADAYGAVTWEGADPTLPHTSIQLRLADGSRLRAEFNLTHTVGDIRRFIRASRPDAAAGAYRLATAFPPQQLDDDSVTIEAAGLANSVIIQK
jgi:UBX domain-containing protein 1